MNWIFRAGCGKITGSLRALDFSTFFRIFTVVLVYGYVILPHYTYSYTEPYTGCIVCGCPLPKDFCDFTFAILLYVWTCHERLLLSMRYERRCQYTNQHYVRIYVCCIPLANEQYGIFWYSPHTYCRCARQLYPNFLLTSEILDCWIDCDNSIMKCLQCYK